VHGSEDTYSNAADARARLAENGYDVTLFSFEGGHTIPPEAKNAAAAWINQAAKSD